MINSLIRKLEIFRRTSFEEKKNEKYLKQLINLYSCFLMTNYYFLRQKLGAIPVHFV